MYLQMTIHLKRGRPLCKGSLSLISKKYVSNLAQVLLIGNSNLQNLRLKFWKLKLLQQKEKDLWVRLKKNIWSAGVTKVLVWILFFQVLNLDYQELNKKNSILWLNVPLLTNLTLILNAKEKWKKRKRSKRDLWRMWLRKEVN